MAIRACASPHCAIPRPEDRDFCDACWRQLPVELRGQLLGNPPSAGRNTPLRNSVLHRSIKWMREHYGDQA